MSHEIMGNRAAYGRGIPAWHQLGTVVEGLMTSDEALKLADADYEVRKQPAHFMLRGEPSIGENGELIDPMDCAVAAPGMFINVAHFDDQEPVPLGMVGSRYEVLQNRDAFRFFDSITEAGEAVFDSCGVLYGGRKVWILAKIPGLSYSIGDSRDVVEQFLLLSNSHDGSAACVCKPTTIRVVCANTNGAALREKTSASLSIRHTAAIHDRLASAAEVMGLTRDSFADTREGFERMADRMLTTTEKGVFIADVLGIKTDGDVSTRSKNNLAMIAELLTSDPLANPDSLWGVYNALTAYTDHQRTVRETDAAGPSATLASRWFGTGAKLKDRALSKALALV
jgi:phage/plasmid-like protein (TIGR03299 family)